MGGFSSREDGGSGVMPRNDRERRAGVNGLWSPVYTALLRFSVKRR